MSSPAPEGSPGQCFAAFISKYGITPLSISPQMRNEIAPLNVLAARLAIKLARECTCLIARPLEEYWSLPLAEVRKELGIHGTNEA
jgi:hypothetical protein